MLQQLNALENVTRRKGISSAFNSLKSLFLRDCRVYIVNLGFAGAAKCNPEMGDFGADATISQPHVNLDVNLCQPRWEVSDHGAWWHQKASPSHNAGFSKTSFSLWDPANDLSVTSEPFLAPFSTLIALSISFAVAARKRDNRGNTYPVAYQHFRPIHVDETE